MLSEAGLLHRSKRGSKSRSRSLWQIGHRSAEVRVLPACPSSNFSANWAAAKLRSITESRISNKTSGRLKIGRCRDRREPARVATGLEKIGQHDTLRPMSTVQEINAAIRSLSLKEQIEVRDALDDLVEDELELTDEFKASIERGLRDIADGRVRVRQPEA